MFTRDDYILYFDQIAKFERAMISSCHDTLSLLNLDDKLIRPSVQEIFRDEARHYAYVRGIFDIMSGAKRVNRRLYKREYSLGDVSIISGNASPGSALCLDISEGGIKIESSRDFTAGETLELDIKLYTEKEAMRRSAKVMWSKRIENGVFIAGLEFTKISNLS